MDDIFLVSNIHAPSLHQVLGDYLSVVVKNDVAILRLTEKYQGDLPRLLSLKRNCETCSGSSAMFFRMARQEEIDRWLKD